MKIVTAAPGAHSIGYVPAPKRADSLGSSPERRGAVWTEERVLRRGKTTPRSAARGERGALPQLGLTKRRAVDFCRVATALCPAGPLRGIRL
jgi:hypothetical protein